MGESDRYGEYRIKKNWRDRIGRDAITLLIAAHIVAFVLLILVLGIYKLAGWQGYEQLMNRLSLPKSIQGLLYQPWSILSYSLTDDADNFFRVLSNMVWLFFYGQILRLYTRDAVIVPVFLYGTVLGAIGFLVFCAVPGYAERQGIQLFGAHNGIIALAMAATVLAPKYKILPQIRGGLSLWIVTLIYLILNVGSIAVVGTGYGVGLMVAAAAGASFSVLLKNDIDASDWMNSAWQKFKLLFVKPTKTMAKEVVFYKTGNREPYSKEPILTAQKIDELLDKINEKGIDALTAKEKEILRKHAEEGDS